MNIDNITEARWQIVNDAIEDMIAEHLPKEKLVELVLDSEPTSTFFARRNNFDGEINDGEYLPPSIEFDEQEIENDFLEQTTLSHQLAHLVEQGKVNKWVLEDASGWDIADLEINIKTK